MGQVGPHGAAAEHVVDVLPGHEQGVEAAEELVEDGLGELAVDGRQPDDAHALPALAHVGPGVLGHGEEGHLVAGLGESWGQLGHDGVEPAPLGGHPTCPEDGDMHASYRIDVTRWRGRHSTAGKTRPRVDNSVGYATMSHNQVVRLLAFPFHDWRKAQLEGVRTRDHHVLEWLMKTESVDEVLVVEDRRCPTTERIGRRRGWHVEGQVAAETSRSLRKARLTRVRHRTVGSERPNNTVTDSPLTKRRGWWFETFEDPAVIAAIEWAVQEAGPIELVHRLATSRGTGTTDAQSPVHA